MAKKNSEILHEIISLVMRKVPLWTKHSSDRNSRKPGNWYKASVLDEYLACGDLSGLAVKTKIPKESLAKTITDYITELLEYEEECWEESIESLKLKIEQLKGEAERQITHSITPYNPRSPRRTKEQVAKEKQQIAELKETKKQAWEKAKAKFEEEKLTHVVSLLNPNK